MASDRIYLDYNASAPLLPEARAAMLAALDMTGNPSSVHAEGRAAHAIIEAARRALAGLLGAGAGSVIFTSGATEAANLALTPGLGDGGAPLDVLIVAAGEHPCVLQGHRFAPEKTRMVPLNGDGVVDLAALQTALTNVPGRCLVALQAANNETGVIQPVAAASRLVHAGGGLLICDAVQAAGRIACDFDGLGADILILSGHKIGGPKGVGALVFADEKLHIQAALLRGGGQESGARAGTENVAAIAGFAAATANVFAGRAAEAERLGGLRAGMERYLGDACPGLVVFGANAGRLGNTSAFAMPDIAAETLLIALDLEGVALSSGSACSSGKVAASHVLAAMGIDRQLARGALRVSIGRGTTETEVERFCETFQKTVRTIRARRSKPAA